MFVGRIAEGGSGINGLEEDNGPRGWQAYSPLSEDNDSNSGRIGDDVTNKRGGRFAELLERAHRTGLIRLRCTSVALAARYRICMVVCLD